jgi:hypothetical protein
MDSCGEYATWSGSWEGGEVNLTMPSICHDNLLRASA